MQFSDIWDDMLHITQEKTGSRLAIPLDLTCAEINMSLRQVVARCRDAVLSKYLVHFRHSTSQATRGGSGFGELDYNDVQKSQGPVRFNMARKDSANLP